MATLIIPTKTTTDNFLLSDYQADFNALNTDLGNKVSTNDYVRAEGYAVDTGTVNAYVITLSPAPTSYIAGQVFNFKAVNTNTGASTLNVNGLGVKTLKKDVNVDLVTGDILAGQIVMCMYDGTYFQVVPDYSASLAANVSEVSFFARNTAPTGYLKANGATVSRTAYARLFTAIGTTFGTGDGSTTFNLPDLRGYFPRGWNDDGSIDAGRTFGSIQSDMFGAHAHPQTIDSSYNAGSGGVAGHYALNNTSASLANSGVNTYSTGGTETRPKNIALLACIKY